MKFAALEGMEAPTGVCLDQGYAIVWRAEVHGESKEQGSVKCGYHSYREASYTTTTSSLVGSESRPLSKSYLRIEETKD